MYKTLLEQESSYFIAGACSLSDLAAEIEVEMSWCTKQQDGDSHLNSLFVKAHRLPS